MASLNVPNTARVSNLVNEAAIKEISEVLQLHGTSPSGLTETEAAARLEKFGPNQVAEEKHPGWLQRLYLAVRNPLVILLSVLAIITFATAGGASDIAGGMLMVAMVVLGISLRFIQETKADNAAAKLKAMISVSCATASPRKFRSNNSFPAMW
jgi:Mg2+-importing ATPase